MFSEYQISISEWFLRDHVTLKTAAENSALPSQEQTTFENVLTRKQYLFLLKIIYFGIFYNITVHCISDQIKAAWLSIRTFFQKLPSVDGQRVTHIAPACRPPCTCADGTADTCAACTCPSRSGLHFCKCTVLLWWRCVWRNLYSPHSSAHYNESQMLCLHIRYTPHSPTSWEQGLSFSWLADPLHKHTENKLFQIQSFIYK